MIMPERPQKDLVEIFGHAPNDLNETCRAWWRLGACPFVALPCTKKNHDTTIVYGTCRVTSPYGDCIICPNRLYFNKFQALKTVALEVFGKLPFLTYQEYLQNVAKKPACVVALGMHSGHEINLRGKLSMDWVLAKIEDGTLLEYTGVEVQSIDITSNYRDAWYAYKNLAANLNKPIPSSAHGMNWANVHKRLIPQIIRKSILYSRSHLVKAGLFFIVPEIVYRKFEEVLGHDLPQAQAQAADSISVHTYQLGPPVEAGRMREVQVVRKLRFRLEDFAQRFISGSHLPSPEELDGAVLKALGMSGANKQA